MANMYDDAIGKSFELLHTILPSAKRIAVLMSGNPSHPQQYKLVENTAKTVNLVVVRVVAATPADLEQAFDRIGQENCDALFVLADPIRPAIVSLAAKTKIPAIYQLSANNVDLGGLASYGPDFEAHFSQGGDIMSTKSLKEPTQPNFLSSSPSFLNWL